MVAPGDDYPRDLIGYGPKPPDAAWPGGARLAFQAVLNYEEGGENAILHGDPASEAFLSEMVGTAPREGVRHMAMESLYEYGSRVGVWRLLRLFESRAIPLTLFAVAMALERNPAVADRAMALGHEICSHGYRWIDYQHVPEAREREHLHKAIEIIERLTGQRPLGWYTGRTSPNTRRLLVEAGGFLYDADDYSDDLPFWTEVEGKRHLVVPYTLDANDMRFATPQGFNSGEQFYAYLKDSFDVLYAEGARTPRMMSLGLHCRLAGRPGRIAALGRFLDYVRKHDKVWFCRRIDIARHWHERHRPSSRGCLGTLASELTMNRFERHPVLTLVLVMAAMLVGFIAIAEWSLAPDDGRLSLQGGESSPYPERYLKLREWQPNTRFAFGPPETRVANAQAPLPETYVLESDRFGFIEPSLVHEDAALEIVFVGGSTTQCLYVLPENRFPYVAGRLLEERLGTTINAINAAKAGNNTLHSLLVTIGKLLPRRPEVVVLMQAANDIGVLKRYGSYWNEHSDFALVVRPDRSIGGLFRGLRDAVVPHSYRRLRRALRSLASSGPGIGQAVAATTLAPAEAARRTALGADFESALRSFTAVVRAWGGQPVLMTQVVLRPGREQETQEGAYLSREALAAGNFTPDGFFDLHGYFNAIIRRVAYSEGATLVDLAALEDWTEADLYDGLHFTDRGSRRVAGLVAAALAGKLEEAAAKP